VRSSADAVNEDRVYLGEQEALSASLEDYLEAILRLERTSRVARVSEIAGQLGVSRPSVTGALKSLGTRRLVSHPYRHVTTKRGRGSRWRSSATAIRDSLGVLGIPSDRAEATARKMSTCRAEISPFRRVRPESLDCIAWGAKRITASSEGGHGESLPHPRAGETTGGLGLNPGAEVRVPRTGSGPLIVEVHGARLALAGPG
jgi:hypothetical protein